MGLIFFSNSISELNLYPSLQATVNALVCCMQTMWKQSSQNAESCNRYFSMHKTAVVRNVFGTASQ